MTSARPTLSRTALAARVHAALEQVRALEAELEAIVDVLDPEPDLDPEPEPVPFEERSTT